MRELVFKLRTVRSLGLLNVARVAWYRAGIKMGFNRARRLRADVSRSPFFYPRSCPRLPAPPMAAWEKSGHLFGNIPYVIADVPPDWLANPVSGRRGLEVEGEWWNIPDFDPVIGDIKLVWELSRMDWLLAFAERAAAGSAPDLKRLNDWLDDWCRHNPPYRGPNWKCGQEASIRVMHLATAALVLEQVECPAAGLVELLRTHLQRIAPTVQYAIAQDNNHGTSEAAALFIGGSWLAGLGVAEGARWYRTGRRLLENRVVRLIGPQGSFSQYSVNYHRLMLDTLSLAEIWRRRLNLPTFSARFLERARAATHWLFCLVCESSGRTPNVGANDGAQLLQLVDADYGDYRPAVQLATALFSGRRAYSEDGPWNYPLRWLDVPSPEAVADRPRSWIADDGGFAILRCGNAMAVMRYPRFRFRPGQSDALHLDLWIGEINLLRDAGTYSYNAGQEWLGYFSGAEAHNTVQFDGRDQMPRLGRFLFGAWLRTSSIDIAGEGANPEGFAAGYRDVFRARHSRQFTLMESRLEVIDIVDGFSRKAVLRWRLLPGAWELDGQCLMNGGWRLSIQSDMPIVRFELIEGWESLHYLEKTPLPVLEVEVHSPGKLMTTIEWNT